MTPGDRWRRLGRRLLLALPLAVAMCVLWPPHAHLVWPPDAHAAGPWHTTIASTYGPCGAAGEPCGGMACNGRQVTTRTWAVAHKTLKCGTRVQVCVRSRCVIVPVQDRGPFVAGRDVDLTYRPGRALRIDGIARARWRTVGRSAGTSATVRVVSVYDGDTLKARFRDGKVRSVRLVQIDTPELRPGECFGLAARDELRRLVLGKRVVVSIDARLDKVDRFGRLLRYVTVGGRQVQHRLVLDGAAAPYFFGGDRGRYASLLARSAGRARSARRGAWRHCPQATYHPTRAWSTGPKATER